MPLLQPWFKHSPWSGNLYRTAPDVWLWRFGFARRDGMSPRSEIGKAVESALAAVQLGTLAEADAAAFATRLVDTAMAGEVSEERADITAIIAQGLLAIKEIGLELMTYQSILAREAGQEFGFAHPIKSKTDFGYRDETIDVKVTWKMPSALKFDHQCQLGVYYALTQKKQSVLYLTPKKHNLIRVPSADLLAGWQTMMSTWRQIEALERQFDTPEAAAKILPLNLDSFYWGDATRPESAKNRIEASEIWGGPR